MEMAQESHVICDLCTSSILANNLSEKLMLHVYSKNLNQEFKSKV